MVRKRGFEELTDRTALAGGINYFDTSPYYGLTRSERVLGRALDEVAADIAPQFRDISGNGFGSFRLSGNATDANSVRGQGSLQLRNAEIYQLPVMLSLLKLPQFKEITRTAFDTSNINFSVFGERIVLDRMELNGDAISLIGNGQINMERDVDLNFYTVVGRNRFYIPLISEIMHSGASSILWINVDGKLDDPRTTRKVLPHLNESLQQLFQGN